MTLAIFDLDNTLYPPQARLFDQIEVRMTQFVMESLKVGRDEADRLRTHYWRTYGTTLAGLMREHDLDPGPYLHEVHEISFDALIPDPLLAARIAALPGRRIIYTNGTAPYAEKVIAARGLSGLFDAIYGVEHASFLPKPERAAYDLIFAADALTPTTAVMFEDDPRNLRAPCELGLETVWVDPRAGEVEVPAPHVLHQTDDLAGFLEQLV